MTIGADRQAWALHLRGIAAPALAGTPLGEPWPADRARAWIDSFADEHGARRRIDRPLLARLLGVEPGPSPARLDPEEALWWGGDAPIRWDADGPLLPGFEGDAIEPATERELCALHALWARRGADARVAPRCLAAAAWHVRELQPDNATALPWAIHVFVELAAAPASRWDGLPARLPDPAEANLHAQSLAHACRVDLGRPGLRAACILLDAARELDAGRAA